MTRFKSPINALYKEFVMKFHTKSGVCTAFTLFMLMLIPLALPGNAVAATGTVASCTDCHGYPPADSATRNTGTGAFAGNHSTHFSVNNCQSCHNTVGASEYNHSMKTSVAGVNYINMTGVIHRSRMGAAAKYNKGVSFPQSATPTLSTCSSVNCHFESVTPTWGQTTTWSSTKTANNNDANCAQCHASTGLTSGNHAKHITAGGGTQTACAKCHPDYNALAGAAAFAHTSSVNAPINVNFAAVPNLGGSYTGGRTGSNFLPSAGISATGSCSSTYCHSPGTLSSGYAAPKVAATWGNTLTCAGCHDSNTATTTLTAKHLKHVGGTGSNYNINCRKCHAATVSNSMTIATVANHVNKNVDITFQNLSGAVSGTYIGAATPYTRAASAVPANAYCSNTYCHSQGRSGSNYTAAVYKTMSTPSWTAAFVLPSGVRACSACHGGDSANNSIQRQITSVAHRRHVGGYASSMYNIGCADCHSLTASTNTTINQTAKHANFQKNVDINATYGGTYTANNTLPGSAAGTCGSVACHSDGRATGKTYVAAQAWNNTPLTCTSCHGNATTNGSAGTALSGRHDKHVNNAAYLGTNFGCVDCHSAVVSNDTTISDRTRHVNTLINYSGARAGRLASCTAFYCHSNGKIGTAVNNNVAPPAWTTAAAALSCKACHGTNSGGFTSTAGEPNYANTGANQPASNSHQKHVGSVLATAQTSCQYCHRLTASATGTTILAGSVDHTDGNIDARLKRPNTFTNFSGTYNKANKTCSATYCHGGGSPVWGAAALACNSCHSALSSDTGFSNNAHKIHVGTAVQARFDVISGNISSAGVYRFGCAACHDPNNATVAHAQGAVSAVQAGNVFFRYTAAGKGSLAAYTANTVVGGTADNTTYNWTTGSGTGCNNTYCHSNGQKGAAFVAGSVVSWATTASTDCVKCHGNGTTGNTLSAPHAAHVNNATVNLYLGCADCHIKTVSSNTVLTDRTRHINKLIDYSGAKAGKFMTVATQLTCGNVYCHSSGNLSAPLAYRNMTGGKRWGVATTTLTCKGCHGYGPGAFTSQAGEPNYTNGGAGTATANSHQKHVPQSSPAAAAASCVYCHSKTTSNGTSIIASSQHINQFNNFTAGGGKTFYKAANSSCSNISCHYNNAVAVQWGATNLTCASCHGTLSTGAHAKHTGAYLARGLTAYLNMTANISPSSGDTNATTLANYGFGCSICHPLLNTNHADGTVDLELNTVAGGGTIRSKTSTWTRNATTGLTTDCSNAYCHSDGKGVYIPTGAWNTTYTINTRCTKCHGNSPADVAHNAHDAGLHYDTLSQKTTNGLIAASGAPGVVAGHGDPAYSTTISCNICHNGTVATSGNKYKADCLACHSGTADTATNGGAIYLSNLRNHVNGSVNVQFAAVTIKTRAQLRPESYGNYTGNATTNGWIRNAGNYKTGLAAYETSKRALNAGTAGFAGETCSNIVCHNGRGNSSPRWVTDRGAGCALCHTNL